MTEKELKEHAGSVQALARKWKLIDTKRPLKMTEYEICNLIDGMLVNNYRRIEKAKKIYKEQIVELEKIKQEPLWRFGKFHEAPPDFRAEYMRAMHSKSATE